MLDRREKPLSQSVATPLKGMDGAGDRVKDVQEDEPTVRVTYLSNGRDARSAQVQGPSVCTRYETATGGGDAMTFRGKRVWRSGLSTESAWRRDDKGKVLAVSHSLEGVCEGVSVFFPLTSCCSRPGKDGKRKTKDERGGKEWTAGKEEKKPAGGARRGGGSVADVVIR